MDTFQISYKRAGSSNMISIIHRVDLISRHHTFQVVVSNRNEEGDAEPIRCFGFEHQPVKL